MSENELSELEAYFSKDNRISRSSFDVKDYLETLHTQSQNGQIDESDTLYEDYIQRLTESGRVSTQELVEILEDHQADTGDDTRNIRFEVFITLLEILQNQIDYERAVEIDKKHGNNFEDKDIYYYFKSKIYDQPHDPEMRRIALRSAYRASRTVDGNQRIYLKLANIIIGVSNSGIDHNINNLPSNQTDLLAVAEENINYAKAIDSQNDEIYATLCLLRLEEGEINEAEKELNKAIKYKNKDDSLNGLDYVFLRRSIRDLRVVDNYVERDLETTRSEVEDLREEYQTKIEEYENEVEDITDSYRRQVLQFIGFFTAIVAVAVTSTQAAIGIGSFPEAGQLILVLIGGIVISFSSLGIIVYELIPWGRIGVLVLAGLLLISIGFDFFNFLSVSYFY